MYEKELSRAKLFCISIERGTTKSTAHFGKIKTNTCSVVEMYNSHHIFSKKSTYFLETIKHNRLVAYNGMARSKSF